MKKKPTSTKRRIRTTSESNTEDELAKAQKRIKQLEKALAQSREDLDLLKKAERFFRQETKK
jgi:transposase